MNMLKRSDNSGQQQHAGNMAKMELLARRARVAKSLSASVVEEQEVPAEAKASGEDLLDSGAPSSDAAAAGGGNKDQHCDGYDKIGCYVVRVYYDWFLVNGSCKCWKSTAANSGGLGNINETIKRIFIGKWKKK